MTPETMSLVERTVCEDAVLDDAGYNPYYRSIGSALDDPLLINGVPVINLASNNYLGLANDSRIEDAYIEAIRKYGVSMCATPVASGYTELFPAVQESLSSFVGVDATVIYPSCYQANNGIFMALARKEDLVLFDRCAHSSLIQGIKSVGCRMLPFAHNDTGSLEYLLARHRSHAHVFVVTESVFSTEGSIAPFAEIDRLCRIYGAIPVVDDSHGIGVLGAHGGGILDHAGITDYDGIYTSSLGKALANNCGIVGARRHVVKYLKYYSAHLVYSTAVAPCVLAGIARTLEILTTEHAARIARTRAYHGRIKMAIAESGLPYVDTIAPINSICAGTPGETILIAKALMAQGVYATPFVYPSVPRREGRVRLIAGANLKEATIARACDIIRTLRYAHPAAEHPCTSV